MNDSKRAPSTSSGSQAGLEQVKEDNHGGIQFKKLPVFNSASKNAKSSNTSAWISKARVMSSSSTCESFNSGNTKTSAAQSICEKNIQHERASGVMQLETGILPPKQEARTGGPSSFQTSNLYVFAPQNFCNTSQPIERKNTIILPPPGFRQFGNCPPGFTVHNVTHVKCANQLTQPTYSQTQQSTPLNPNLKLFASGYTNIQNTEPVVIEVEEHTKQSSSETNVPTSISNQVVMLPSQPDNLEGRKVEPKEGEENFKVETVVFEGVVSKRKKKKKIIPNRFYVPPALRKSDDEDSEEKKVCPNTSDQRLDDLVPAEGNVQVTNAKIIPQSQQDTLQANSSGSENKRLKDSRNRQGGRKSHARNVISKNVSLEKETHTNLAPSTNLSESNFNCTPMSNKHLNENNQKSTLFDCDGQASNSNNDHKNLNLKSERKGNINQNIVKNKETDNGEVKEVPPQNSNDMNSSKILQVPANPQHCRTNDVYGKTPRQKEVNKVGFDEEAAKHKNHRKKSQSNSENHEPQENSKSVPTTQLKIVNNIKPTKVDKLKEKSALTETNDGQIKILCLPVEKQPVGVATSVNLPAQTKKSNISDDILPKSVNISTTKPTASLLKTDDLTAQVANNSVSLPAKTKKLNTCKKTRPKVASLPPSKASHSQLKTEGLPAERQLSQITNTARKTEAVNAIKSSSKAYTKSIEIHTQNVSVPTKLQDISSNVPKASDVPTQTLTVSSNTNTISFNTALIQDGTSFNTHSTTTIHPNKCGQSKKELPRNFDGEVEISKPENYFTKLCNDMPSSQLPQPSTSQLHTSTKTQDSSMKINRLEFRNLHYQINSKTDEVNVDVDYPREGTRGAIEVGSSKETSSSNVQSPTESLRSQVVEVYDYWKCAFVRFEETALKSTNEQPAVPAPSPALIEEKRGDVFAVSSSTSLVHCVAEDLRMGYGIAVDFRKKFGRVPKLLQQRCKTGEVAVLPDPLENPTRYIYYLVTKAVSVGKPTMWTLESSLLCLKEHCQQNCVTELAMPRIGCGLDLLFWSDVLELLHRVFSGTNIRITIFTLDVDPGEDLITKNVVLKHKYHAYLPDIELNTGRVFLASEGPDVDETMQKLNTKFRFLPTYQQTKRIQGECFKFVCKFPRENIYGLVVRGQKMNGRIDYLALDSALRALNKHNRKDEYNHFAIEAFYDESDVVVMDKLVTAFRWVLNKYPLDLHICWPTEIMELYGIQEPQVEGVKS